MHMYRIELKQQPEYTWQCPYCLGSVGYLGRIFAWAFGGGFHGCNRSNIKFVRKEKRKHGSKS